MIFLLSLYVNKASNPCSTSHLWLGRNVSFKLLIQQKKEYLEGKEEFKQDTFLYLKNTPPWYLADTDVFPIETVWSDFNGN